MKHQKHKEEPVLPGQAVEELRKLKIHMENGCLSAGTYEQNQVNVRKVKFTNQVNKCQGIFKKLNKVKSLHLCTTLLLSFNLNI